ncbi:lytic murein transglycosylase [Glacieibacterium frigidum]|uniref:Lytic murein transglycosylase n=1 Tax=Glacieibacterium frigidum TaxID=2593303 RepID=A0A552UJV2_9SPHN|nr:lytic murein transglycosylase [Glacieibacterium frigidum]
MFAAPLSAQVLAPEPVPEEEVVDATAESGFEAWLSTYRASAQARGIRPETLDAAFTGLHFSPRVVALDRNQPDDSGVATLFSDYLSKRLEPVREARGRAARERHAAKLAELEAATGVPASIVLGIWGMESSYGAVTGNFDVLRSLASLAYDGRRRELFERELTAALTMLDKGLATRERMKGSWAGAMGQPQFLPSSFVASAVDGDGDGVADIWESGDDTAASIANYLKRAGWQRGLGWGVAVQLPADFDRERVRDLVQPRECVRVLAKHSRWVPLSEWKKLGLTRADGNPWPADNTLATLVEPDGPGGAAYLTFGNYRRLLDYNCSNFYALSVALLGDALK